MKLQVPFVDLSRAHAPLRAAFEAAFGEVLDSGWFLLGQQTKAFEAEFSAHEGCSMGVACGSGSDALFLALRAIGVGPGDSVATVANSFVATSESIARTGASVSLVDPCPRTCCMDPADLSRLLGEPGAESLKAVIPVHLYGRPADVSALRQSLDAAGRKDVVIIGDAAQAHGSPGVGRATELTCYSFYPGKNLGALGDGGMVISDNPVLIERMRSLRNHGRASKHSVDSVGVNSRFDEVQAAILRIKLKSLRDWSEARRAVARAYRERLAGISGLELPEDVPEHVYHLFAVQLRPARDETQEDLAVLAAYRDAVADGLTKRGVATGQHYPVAVHQMPPYQTERSLPVSDRLAASVLSLPMFPGLRLDEIDHVCDSIKAVIADLEEAP